MRATAYFFGLFWICTTSVLPNTENGPPACAAFPHRTATAMPATNAGHRLRINFRITVFPFLFEKHTFVSAPAARGEHPAIVTQLLPTGCGCSPDSLEDPGAYERTRRVRLGARAPSARCARQAEGPPPLAN